MTFIPYFDDIKEALSKPGCAFCRLRDKTTFAYVDALLFELVNDPESRAIFNKARGYCERHIELLLQEGHALGATILMNGLLKTIRRIILNRSDLKAKPSQLNKLLNQVKLGNREALKAVTAELGPQIQCPVCTQEDTLNKFYAQTLLKYFTGPHALAKDFEQSDGLCIPHLRLVLMHAVPGDTIRQLITMQEAIWETVAAELEGFIQKSDHTYKGPPIRDEEAISRIKAMSIMTGIDLYAKKKESR